MFCCIVLGLVFVLLRLLVVFFSVCYCFLWLFQFAIALVYTCLFDLGGFEVAFGLFRDYVRCWNC